MPVYVPDENGELSSLDGSILSQQATQMPGDLGATFAKMFITLIVLVALLFITYWFLRRLIQNRLQKGVGNSSIQILEKRMISPKTMLYLIEVEGKKTLIAESHLEIKRVLDFPQN
ncbi:MAG: flagellar biosynthetic protein FliO [Parachlamydiales bacterium]|nr:flagellar biosynthetic protein FliO [Parachlamydiales bacterium]